MTEPEERSASEHRNLWGDLFTPKPPPVEDGLLSQVPKPTQDEEDESE